MGFVEAVKSGLSRYVDFGGRSSRSEYWWWVLFTYLGYVPIVLLGMVSETLSGLLLIVFALGILLPSIAVAIRRLHDRDKSGWWFLLAFVPIASLVLIVWFCLPGTVGPNRFGYDPLGGNASTFD